MNQTLQIELLSRSDAAEVTGVMTRAFASDPAARWLFADARTYATFFPRFLEAFAGRAYAHEGVRGIRDTRTGRLAGCAMWLPPGVVPDGDAVGSVLAEALTTDQLAKAGPIFELMEGYHPHEPLWYLPMLGVDPSFQCQGIGSELLSDQLSHCDQTDTAAYLEASSPRSATLYGDFGFQAIGLIQAGDSPTILPMIRRPVTSGVSH